MENPIINNDLNDILASDLIDWNKLRNTTFLITGANGILASYLVRLLLYLNVKKGYNIKVIALVRNIQKAKNKFKDIENNPYLEFLVQDVCNRIIYKGDVDYVIHSASQASPKYYGIDPVGTINANVLGTTNILQFAQEKQTKSVLFFSSGAIYGVVSDTKKEIAETDYGIVDPMDLKSCYAESKRLGENLCISWSYQYGINVKIVRPFHVYGPGMDLDDGRVFSDFCKNIICNEDIILKSDGSASRPFCYISDATIAFMKILLDGKNREAYNVGNPSCEISILELAKKLIEMFPEKKLSVRRDVSKYNANIVNTRSSIHKLTPNIDKLIMMGWSPKISIQEGFRRVIDSYLN
ncbi:MAG: NAD-dependent epimerase/dehydratase family protein [Bacteroides sp.]|nr:NAD-dependent epimerase/dehydratase family protein [Bacteroides sp.]